MVLNGTLLKYIFYHKRLKFRFIQNHNIFLITLNFKKSYIFFQIMLDNLTQYFSKFI